jgi:hypothetical protein
MKNSGPTEIVLILSRSGMMQNFRRDSIASFHQLLARQMEIPGDVRVTLALFDTDYEYVLDGMKLGEIMPIDEAAFSSEGSCALLDAVGKTAGYVQDRIGKTPEQDRPSRVIVAILADGKDDSSRDFTEKHLSRLIKSLQKDYGWKFIYAGSNQDPFAEARAISIQPERILHYELTDLGVKKAYSDINDLITRIRTGRSL